MPQILLLGLGTMGCGALAVDDLSESRGGGVVGGFAEGDGSASHDSEGDDLSSPETPSPGVQSAPVCTRPIAVEVVTLESTGAAGEDSLLGSEAACYEALVPAGANWDESGPRSCVELEPGQSAEVFLKVALGQQESAGGFVFQGATGLAPVHLAVTVEHELGELECPAFNGDNYIGLTERFVKCLLPNADGPPGFEHCPCKGVAPTTLSSIRGVRWRAVHDAAVSTAGKFCLGDAVLFCGSDCASEF